MIRAHGGLHKERAEAANALQKALRFAPRRLRVGLRHGVQRALPLAGGFRGTDFIGTTRTRSRPFCVETSVFPCRLT